MKPPRPPPTGILGMIARHQRHHGPLEPVLAKGARWLGSRIEGNDRVLLFEEPGGNVVEQRMRVYRKSPERVARELRERFRVV
jgi:hypothetical protein